MRPSALHGLDPVVHVRLVLAETRSVLQAARATHRPRTGDRAHRRNDKETDGEERQPIAGIYHEHAPVEVPSLRRFGVPGSTSV
jgi:hypothetical protein